MLSSLRDNLTFFRNFRKRFETTGSIIPSSQSLARSMSRFLAKRGDAPIRVLEIGPGTGPVTRRIVTHLRDGDVFDLVELNEEFAAVLQRKFETEPAWQAVAHLSTIHRLPLQEYQPPEGYDFIISGLPMANFPAEMVEELCDKYFEVRTIQICSTNLVRFTIRKIHFPIFHARKNENESQFFIYFQTRLQQIV